MTTSTIEVSDEVNVKVKPVLYPPDMVTEAEVTTQDKSATELPAGDTNAATIGALSATRD
jgi:hypothetical protein